jgi:iron complex outermembrane receptor protein
VQRYGIGTYPLVEWTVGRQFKYLKPYLQLTNLTDTKYQEIAGVAKPGRGVIAGMEVRWKAK